MFLNSTQHGGKEMFRNAKKIIAFALAAITVLLTLSACGGDGTTEQDTTADSTADTSTVTPSGSDLTADYKIIYEDGSDKAASRVRNALRDAVGSTPESKKASAFEGEYKYSVLIGNTGKAESTAFIDSLGENEYGVKILESAGSVIILVAGKTSEINGYAVDLLINDYMPKEKGDTQLLKNDTTIMIYVPPVEPETPTGYGGIEFEEQIITVANVSGIPYTRMTKLQDGRLMMVYGQSNQIVAVFSSDNGLTWSKKVTVTDGKLDQDDKDGKKMYLANAMAYQTEDGTILVAYRCNEAVNRKDGDDSIKVTGKYHSSIRIMGSTDNGKTFQRHSIVWDLYEENIQKWYASCGLWEPHLGMLNGELACFFAIGKSVYEYNHPINSTDIFVYRNNKWVRADYTSNETPGSVKNGMPVFQELKDGGYVMSVESNQNNSGPYKSVLTAKLFTSKDGINWVNQCDVYIPKKSKRKSGAPYVIELPNGQLVVSYMTDDELLKPTEGDKGCIFKISVSKPGISAFDLKGEDDFEGPYNIFDLPVGSTSVYGGMYMDDEYLYVYCATDNGGNQILLRRAPLSQFNTAE